MFLTMTTAAVLALLSLGCDPAKTRDSTNTNMNTNTGTGSTGGTGPASITGRVCASNGQFWLEGAEVYTHIKDGSQVVDTRQTTTDAGGNYVLDDLPPDSSYDVFIQVGAERLSDQETTGIYLNGGQNLVLDEPPCEVLEPLNTAIIRGDYDNADSIILPFGFPWVEIDGTDAATLVSFLTTEDLTDYDFIVVESGVAEDGVVRGSGDSLDAVATALRDWVEQGGVLLVTDWSYDVVVQAFPGYIHFVGDDTQADAAQVGVANPVDAAVSDGQLAAEAGFDFMTVEFNRREWAVVEELDPGATALVEAAVDFESAEGSGSVDTSSLLTRFARGQGYVFYASFTLEENDGPQALTLLRSALALTVSR